MKKQLDKQEKMQTTGSQILSEKEQGLPPETGQVSPTIGAGRPRLGQLVHEGKLMAEQGQYDRAIHSYQNAVDRVQSLAGEEKVRLTLRMMLYHEIAACQNELDRKAEAFAMYRSSCVLYERLAAQQELSERLRKMQLDNLENMTGLCASVWHSNPEAFEPDLYPIWQEKRITLAEELFDESELNACLELAAFFLTEDRETTRRYAMRGKQAARKHYEGDALKSILKVFDLLLEELV